MSISFAPADQPAIQDSRKSRPGPVADPVQAEPGPVSITRIGPNSAVVRPRGHLDAGTCPGLCSVIESLWSSGDAYELILDFSELEFVGVAALELLTRFERRQLDEPRLRWGLITGPPSLDRALYAAGMSNRFPTASTVPEMRATMMGIGSSPSVTLRDATRRDSNALAAMHERCSLETLYARYHTGMRQVPSRWLGPLVTPAYGHTVLAVDSEVVVGYAQLIPVPDEPGAAEVSVLVEDGWQRRGIGSALLSSVCDRARSWSLHEVFGLSLPQEAGFARTAKHLGMECNSRHEKGFARIGIALSPV